MKRSSRKLPLAIAFVAVVVTAFATAGQARESEKALHGEPIVIAHRGASGYRPEHTLPAYKLAIDMGADYIEPDLVSTKDGVLVARHENEISGTTDVASHPEFATRFTTKTIDGVPVSGWFTEDFTLTELRTLRAKKRIPALRPTNAAFDGLSQVPTLQEVIDLAKAYGVGIYPETKHPTFFDSIGLSLEEPLVSTLRANGWDRKKAPVFIQSFEVSNLKVLNRMTDVPLVQLINATGKPYDFVVSGDPRTYADLASPTGLKEISRYADGVGPNTAWIVPTSGNVAQAPTSFVPNAHRERLVVHPWTFRRENTFLPEQYREGNPAHPLYLAAAGNLPGWLALFYELGVDGVFTDNPDTGVAVREEVFVDRKGKQDD
ncbi:MAG: glycerophosphodiester phosphodiesterase [Actinomycetota bacterium]|nr:glycerophosphodiester phosphodiesterase [Actinomycetota bacterium]